MTWSRVLLVCACAGDAVWAQRVGAPTDDLAKVSVEELFSIQVSSVGRKAQQLAKAPAAVFVLTAEDIRRTGATSIPEALEWVPGLTVLSLDGRSWAISARDSGRLYSNQMLVMIDGRSLYNPLFSGVIWDSIDVPLEDIEQIEVVRGPGAVMWGPNAVNGVINIITKRAQATKGGRVSLATGNQLRGAAEARWGAEAGDRAAYRVWGRMEYRTPGYGSPGYYSFGDSTYRDPSLENLNWATGRLGFRLDLQPSDRDQWMFQGDLYRMGRQDALAYPVLLPNLFDRQQAHSDYEGGYVQSRWTHTTPAGHESALQFSFDRNAINYPFAGGTQNNLNIDFQKRRPAGENNEIYWGAGFQQYWDSSYFTRLLGLNPRDSAYRAGDVVFRDEWQIWPGRLLGSAGIRIDYNSYTRIEYQPSLRLLYTPSNRQSAWIALSRAVKVPSRGDRDMDYSGGATLVGDLPVETSISGSHTLRSEATRSVEAGYRYQSGQRWSLDLSIFHSTYSRLIVNRTSLIPQISFSGPIPVVQLPSVNDNLGAERSYGAEVWGLWQVHPGWRLAPSYAYLRESSWLPEVPGSVVSWGRLPQDLRHQGRLRLEHDLSRAWQLDVMARYRSREATFQAPGVLLVDARLAYRPARSGELSLSVKNLTDRRVLETYSEFCFPAIPVRRTFVVKWTQRF